MTDTTTDQPTESGVSVISQGQGAGLPTATHRCPYCETTGTCQQLPDDPSENSTSTLVPFGCLTCGAEFAAGAPA